MKRFFNLFLLSLMLPLTLLAKEKITVQGMVYGDKKEPIVGAIVKNLSDNSMMTTDIDGQFILTADEGTKLEVTALGYSPKIVKIKTTHMDIYMSKGFMSKKFAVKPNFEIDIVNYLHHDSEYSDYGAFTTDAKTMSFGVDFGYTFYAKKNSFWEVNAGLAYKSFTGKFDYPYLDFSYYAYANADIDGNTYIRCYDMYELNQQINVGYLSIPVYLRGETVFGKRVGLFYDLGVNFDFNLSSKMSKFRGSGDVYGIYPEYGDLVIDAPYMNDFGYSSFPNAYLEKPSVKTTNIGAFIGVGLEFFIWGPLSIDASVRAKITFTDIFKYTDPYAPIVYTLHDGETVYSLSDFMTKSIFTNLTFRAGINYRF